MDGSKDPFSWIDGKDPRVWRLHPNIFHDGARFRKTVLLSTLACLVVWVLMGFDSGPLQVEKALEAAGLVALGRAPFSKILEDWTGAYGWATHWSALVIYGIEFWALSWHYDRKLGLKGSRNISLSFMFTLASIGAYERIWQILYGHYQVPWFNSLQMPQLGNILQNTIFISLGIVALIWVGLEDYQLTGMVYQIPLSKGISMGFDTWMPRLRPRIDRWLLVLLILAAAGWLLYIYYPLPVQSITVSVKGLGDWTSSSLFPQTLHTIDVDLTDRINAGMIYYVQNDQLHAVNVLNKVLMTLPFLYVAFLRPAESGELNNRGLVQRRRDGLRIGVGEESSRHCQAPDEGPLLEHY